MITAVIILGIVLVAFCLKGFWHDDGDAGNDWGGPDGGGGDGGGSD